MKSEQLIPGVMAHIQKALHDVAEQQIQDAVKEFEAKARRAIAGTVMATIDAAYTVERHGFDLRITVRLPRAEAG